MSQSKKALRCGVTCSTQKKSRGIDLKDRFMSLISQSLPHMSEEIMEGWLNNPKALKKYLKDLSPNG